MKKIASIVLLSSAFVFTACDMKKASESTVVTADSTAVEAPQSINETAPLLTVKGTITELQQGKDGVTAKVKDEDGKYYTIVISIVNLKEKDMYRPLVVGDVITVHGEQWEMDGETHIKAHTLEK